MTKKPTEDHTSKELAEDRTELAQERTYFADERTFLAWLRTGLALVGAGLGVVKFLDPAGPAWLTKLMGALLVIAGEASYIFAYWRFKQTRGRYYHNLKITPVWLLGVITLTTVAMTIISLLVIVKS